MKCQRLKQMEKFNLKLFIKKTKKNNDSAEIKGLLHNVLQNEKKKSEMGIAMQEHTLGSLSAFSESGCEQCNCNHKQHELDYKQELKQRVHDPKQDLEQRVLDRQLQERKIKLKAEMLEKKMEMEMKIKLEEMKTMASTDANVIKEMLNKSNQLFINFIN